MGLLDRILGRKAESVGFNELGDLLVAGGTVGKELLDDKIRKATAAALLGGTAGAAASPGDRRAGALRGGVGGILGGISGGAMNRGPLLSAATATTGGALAGYLGNKAQQEKPMRNKYAGVVLDHYDDKGETLKRHYPTIESLPDIIKQADIRPKAKLNNEDFALIAIDEGYVMRKFACHDPGTTAMSVIYFAEHGDKLPEEAQKTAAANLADACRRYGVKQAALSPETLEILAKGPLAGALGGGVAQMAMDPQSTLSELGASSALGATTGFIPGGATRNAAIGGLAGAAGPALVQSVLNSIRARKSGNPVAVKTASVVNITGKRPTAKIKVAKPMNDNDYAVILPDGQRLYPIHSWDMVKKAEDYYQTEGLRMAPEIRRQFATKLAAKSDEIGYPLDGTIKEAGSIKYASWGHRKAALEMRKVACPPGQARQALDVLFEKSASLRPDVYAEVLRRFDVDQGLDKGWDHVVLDPWASTFGIDKTAAIVWEQGGERVSDGQLQTLARNNLDPVKQAFGFEFADEFAKDPVGMFKSMPDPDKKILARMAFDSANQGGSEFEDKLAV